MESQLDILGEEPLLKRSSSCKRGHEFTPENTRVTRRGVRFCVECNRKRGRDWARKKSADTPGVDVVCPNCKKVRTVAASTGEKLRKWPRLCFSCSRKQARKGMMFVPRECRKCGKAFSGRSGAAVYCDPCVKRKPNEVRECPICQTKFTGYKGKKVCSPACRRRARLKDTYFGGRMFEAIGWKEKQCQICEKHLAKKAHVHHVFGHPDHSLLVVLCAGCHNAVSMLAGRKGFGEDQFKRLRWYAMAQRFKAPPKGEPRP